MKRVLILSLMAGLAMGVFATEKSGLKDPKQAAILKKNAESLEASAKDAESKGKADLAAAYRKCAEAKNKMSEAYTSGDSEALKKANSDYINANAELDKIQKGLKDKPAAKAESTGSKRKLAK